MKLTKKQKKANRQLAIQVNRVQRLENKINDEVPVIMPVNHYFTDNEDTRLNVCCRELFVPAGTVLTGVIYKIEVFWTMMKGRMRIIEGDHTKDIEAPLLLKNVVGIKNGGYAYEDCLFYGFCPNPDNSRDLEEIINLFSATPANEVQGFPNNKQMLNYQKRLNHEKSIAALA